MRTSILSRSRSSWVALLLGASAATALLVAGLGVAQNRTESVNFIGPPSFADVVEQVNPAVVNIAVTKNATPRPAVSGTPFDDFFGQFFGIPGMGGQNQLMPAPRPVQGQGSGFIIDAEGYIATNNHVVEGASEVTVTLNSGEQYTATVVGTDPTTDLALLKIENGGNLPYVTFGDSDRARVGEWVLAIGNPFGLGGSATAGIVSARGRDIRSGPYDDYLQIDAPINSGNSGGPVFNAAGEVIGINTAIFSPNGGNIGIGFAIPSNNASRVLEDLRDGGVVSRGYLGISIQDVDEELAEAFSLDQPTGALVAEVTPDSAAEKAGIAIGDVIVRINDRDVDTGRTLARIVGALNPGETVEVELYREGRRQTIDVELGQRVEGQQASLGPAAQPALGLTLETLTDQRKAELGLDPRVEGALVTAVAPNSPAARQGLQPGDVIMSVNRNPTRSAEEAAANLSRNGRSLVLVHRGGRNYFVAISPA